MRASIAVAVGAVASVTFFASFDAHACGESLFRVGRGVAYRAQTAPLPGNVLVVAPSAESKELAERLSAAGHNVRVVDSPEQVAQEIRSGKYDVVLASYNDRGLIETDSAGVAKAPAYIPVATEDSRRRPPQPSVSALSVGRRRLHAVSARHPSHAEGRSEGVSPPLVDARRVNARTRFLLCHRWSPRCLRLAGVAARAQDVTRDPAERRGEIDITYQYSEEQNLHTSNIGTIQHAGADDAVARLQRPLCIEGALDDRGRVALISRKWGGDGKLPEDPGGYVHDPRNFVPPHNEATFTDDGHYHTYFQDWRLGGRYLLMRDPVIIEPYVMIGFPSTDYPFLGSAAPGEHVRREEIGSTFAYRPPFLNWYFSVEIGYQYVEKTLDVNKNATRVDAEIVYFVNPKVAVKLFASSKNGHGIEPPLLPISRRTSGITTTSSSVITT